MITLEDAKKLQHREVLVDELGRRWYVNGRVKTWKRDQSRIRIPLKHGLYAYSSLDERDFVDGVCSLVTKEA